MGATGVTGDEESAAVSPDALPDAPLTVAAVAHRLGVAPATLRTWARRYGLGPTAHTPGAHRRYAPEDVGRLQTMRRLTLDGVPPAAAAEAALATPVVAAPHLAPLPDTRGGLAPAVRPAAGGRVLPLPGAEAAVRGLARAAMSLDAAALTASVRHEVEQRGVVGAWEQVLSPVLIAVGARWAATGEGVEVEHLLSDCITGVLRASPAPARAQHRPVLLASAPDEQHALPLHALSAALSERGLGSRTLGPSLPADALAAAVRRTGAGVLFLWSQLPRTGNPAVLDALPTTRPPTAVVVGGPGWAGAELPERVTPAHDLGHALSLVEQALGV